MLPQEFRFSQGSLQDYVDCPRRFQLRYVEAQAWPAVQAEPLLDYEDHVERGTRFHRLVERHQLGVDVGVLEASIQSDLELLSWWRAYLGFGYLHGMEGLRYPEFSLSIGFGGCRLMAKFDLVVVVPGERVVIFDWKTVRRVPSREWFESRLQTRVYPFVFVRGGVGLFGGAVRPEQVLMVYWVVGGSQSLFEFGYSRERLLSDEEYLSRLLGDIGSRGEVGSWPLTLDDVRCGFCAYRSLCGRKVSVGRVDDLSMSVDNIALGGEFGFCLGAVGEDVF